ncbi:MAG: nitrate/nitrite transporter [Betaproteobacteria bacterium]
MLAHKAFWKAGHRPTLLAAFLYYDLAFMVWVLLGSLAVQIAQDLHLSHAQQGLVVATPVLAGAILRMLMGILVDHIGPKKAGALGQLIVMVALLVAWYFGIHSYHQTLLLGAFLGFAGASFAVALPLASRWYPPEHQGKALGIAGAGNSGTALVALLAPSLAMAVGWNTVFGWAVLPLAVVFVIYLMVAKDAPESPPRKSLSDYIKVMKDRDAWWFMFFYSVTFGGFVGLTSSLNIYFNIQFGLDAKMSGIFTAACVAAGSMARPLGGSVADRVGGIRSLMVIYGVAAFFLTLASFGLPQAWMALVVFVCAMIALGMGNGAVFQLVPQRFRKEIGVMTGLVGMTGGMGGFYLSSSLGFSEQLTGSYRLGLLVFAALALLALAGLSGVKKRWRTTWGAAHLTVAKI